MAKRRKYKRPRRTAITTDRKARSMQVSWRKATDKTSTLTIEDAKKIITNTPDCPYCGSKIKWNQLSIDHAEPSSRGGKSIPSNLVWSCRICNISKGSLNKSEFIALMEFLNQHPRMKEEVLSRLRAGGARFGRRKR